MPITNVRNKRLQVPRPSPFVRPKPLSTRQRLNEIQHFINICFVLLETQDDREIAAWTGLSRGTIHRLRAGAYTPAIRVNTFLSIGRAAGLEMTWTSQNSALIRKLDNLL